MNSLFYQKASNVVIQHYRDFSIPAGAWIPNSTNGAAAGTTVYGSIEIDHYAFDASTEESVFITFRLPEDYNGGTLGWEVGWDAIATASGTVQWGLSGGAFDNDDALSTALGAEQTATDTLLAVGDYHTITGTAITLAGTPVAGDFVVLKLVAKTAGTIAVDVLGLNLQIQYQTKTTQIKTAW